jgi:3-methyladenine DNA glycosylase Mpg
VHNGATLLSGPLSIRPPRARDARFEVGVSSRIGISRAVEHPYRFFMLDNRHVSGPKSRNGAGGRAPRKERRHA